MTKYVDIDAAKEAVRMAECDANYDGRRFDAEFIENALDFIPAADVAPVVLGHWKKDRDTIKCTVCGFGMFPNRYTFMHGVCVTDNKLPKYCENCGAKMGTTEEQSV
jgi:hypothetical protein